MQQREGEDEKTSLNLDNAIWANSVIASGTAVGVVIYTGSETRSVMNTSQPASKVGNFIVTSLSSLSHTS